MGAGRQDPCRERPNTGRQGIRLTNVSVSPGPSGISGAARLATRDVGVARPRISMGNWLAGMDTPGPEAVGELVAALSDEDAAVAEAAAWALGRAGARR